MGTLDVLHRHAHHGRVPRFSYEQQLCKIDSGGKLERRAGDRGGRVLVTCLNVRQKISVDAERILRNVSVSQTCEPRADDNDWDPKDEPCGGAG